MMHALKYFHLILNYFQVSEDPSMREEMEKEVGSTNSAVVAAAAGWANWAVGAVTAKFYKSPPAPAPGAADKDKSASPASAESSLAEGVKSKVNISSEPAIAKQSSERESSSSNNDAGWDVAEDDGWGDLDNDQEEEVKNDGWDDNDDWGSLEDNKSESKSVSQPSYDHSGGFNQGVKSHAAFSDLQQTSAPASDNLMAGPGGWDDWGEGRGEESKEEARRRREEKRVERQKELQSKRAAKKGPMKLGAKKMID